jgi:hypothetical protein
MRSRLSILFLLLSFASSGQKTRSLGLRFMPTYAGRTIVFEDQFYPLASGDSVVFDLFRFYVSELVLMQNGKVVFREENSYHLLSSDEEMEFRLDLPEMVTFDELQFNLGVDSATSTSGALGGDLDPAKGMFWTWQSGYINSKLEGRSSLCPTRHHEFQLHLGGYASTDNCLQKIRLPAHKYEIEVEIPLDRLLSDIDLAKDHSIMSPGPEAVSLSRHLAGIFTTKQ